MSLTCLACTGRVEVCAPTSGDAVWRCYCPACDVTVVLAAPRYDGPGVETFWHQARGGQLALPFGFPPSTGNRGPTAQAEAAD